MNVYEPHNWIGIIGLLVITVGAIVPAWIAASRGRKATTQGDKVLDQVRNNHDTPLRSDIDRLIEGQEQIASLLSDTHKLVVDHNRQISGLRDDVDVLKKGRHTK